MTELQVKSVRKPIHKVVGYEEYYYYTTSDGQEWGPDREKEALLHQEELDRICAYVDRWEKIKSVQVNLDVQVLDQDEYITAYYAENQDDVMFILEHLGYKKGVTRNRAQFYFNDGQDSDEIEAPCWIVLSFEDGGDYNPDRYFFYTLEHIQEKLLEFISNVDQQTSTALQESG